MSFLWSSTSKSNKYTHHFRTKWTRRVLRTRLARPVPCLEFNTAKWHNGMGPLRKALPEDETGCFTLKEVFTGSSLAPGGFPERTRTHFQQHAKQHRLKEGSSLTPTPKHPFQLLLFAATKGHSAYLDVFRHKDFLGHCFAAVSGVTSISSGLALGPATKTSGPGMCHNLRLGFELQTNCLAMSTVTVTSRMLVR